MWPSELHFHTNFQPAAKAKVIYVDGLAVKPARLKRRRRGQRPAAPAATPVFRPYLVK